MRAYLTRLLAPLWAVRTTANGEEALRAVAERRPDIVLTDVMMPRVDGFELLRALRSDPATRHIPVIMLTARAGPGGLGRGPRGRRRRLPRQAVPGRRADRPGAGGRSSAPPGGRRPGRRLPAPPPSRAAAGRRRRPAPRPPTADRGRPRLRRRPQRARPPERQRGSWRLPSSRVVGPGAAPRPARRAGRRRASTRTRPTTCCWPPARRRPTRSSTPRTRPSRSSTSPSACDDGRVRIAVRDYGQWRERVPSMDRGPRLHADERVRRRSPPRPARRARPW